MPAEPQQIDHWLWCSKGLVGVAVMLRELQKSGVPCSEIAKQCLESVSKDLFELSQSVKERRHDG